MVCDPIARFESHFFHLSKKHVDIEKPDALNRRIDMHVNNTMTCIKDCLRSFGSSLTVDDALAGQFDWYSCCATQFPEEWGEVSNSFTAEQLRVYVCEFLYEPRSKPCPAMLSDELHGILSPSRQNRFLILQKSDLVAQPSEVLNLVMEFLGLPQQGDVEALPSTNRHKHTSEMSSVARASLQWMYRHQLRLVQHLTGLELQDLNVAV